MAGMKFEYDENGAKFVYFLISFYAMIIIPCTYYLWPRKEKKREQHPEDLSCFEPCLIKNQLLNQNIPKKRLNEKIIKIVLFIGWIIFLVLAYKASQIEIEHKEYDPYIILNIDRGATDKEIRKAYRDLSKVMHPDKGGDEEKYRELVKAYKSLTDDEIRKNWEEYGNPDGPGATQFGIALPKWIVEGKNSYLVLGAYVLVFMVIMPTIVGIWWYKSIKYTGDQVLINTTKVYYSLIMKTSQIIVKRAIMILGSSFEFEKSSNTDIVERPTDNVEMPQLMRELPDLQEKIREFPFSCIYSIKARALIHAHLLRLPLPAATLQKDKNVIIKKCPFLINEMVNVVSNIFATISQNGAPKHIHPPTLETLENIMKLSPMIVQALWDKNKKYSLLQLPHIVENHLRHFVTKKRNICDIKQFVSMKDADRRSILRHLTNEQYEDILRVAGSYPLIEMDVKTKVFDDEDEQTITVGAIVTVVVNLTRKNLQVLFEKENQSDQTTNEELLNESNQEDGLIVEEVEQQQKPVVVNKQVAKSKNNNKKNKNSKQPQPQQTKQIKETESNEDDEEEDSAAEDIETIGNSSIESKSKSKPTKTSNNNNEEYFEKFQQLQKKREKLEAKTKISHRVYCPYYSDVKQECWWLYVADRKNHSIICPPTYICSLKTNEELELRFLAPKTPGTYTYSVSLRSDSYLDFDVFQNIKLDVEKAKDIEEHPQWDFSDEEANKSDNEKDDEFETESDSD